MWEGFCCHVFIPQVGRKKRFGRAITSCYLFLVIRILTAPKISIGLFLFIGSYPVGFFIERILHGGAKM